MKPASHRDTADPAHRCTGCSFVRWLFGGSMVNLLVVCAIVVTKEFVLLLLSIWRCQAFAFVALLLSPV